MGRYKLTDEQYAAAKEAAEQLLVKMAERNEQRREHQAEEASYKRG